MKDIEFDVELTAKDLYRFSMRHTYSGVSGIFGVVISLACWIILAVRFGALDCYCFTLNDGCFEKNTEICF